MLVYLQRFDFYQRSYSIEGCLPSEEINVSLLLDIYNDEDAVEGHESKANMTIYASHFSVGSHLTI